MSEVSVFLDHATRIGQRLVRAAQWANGKCTWMVWTPHPDRPWNQEWVHAPAAGELYQGSAGIGLFLSELHRMATDRTVALAAKGALKHAVAAAAALPADDLGFHSGRVGIAYAAARGGQVLDEPSLLVAARRLLQSLRGREGSDTRLDVIGGAAGAIPPLLWLARAFDWDEARDMALTMGEHLLAGAIREPFGWSWPTPGLHIRNLTGFGHGTAGIGLALLELATTGDGRFRHAGEQAFRYERRFLDPARGNWPDFRDGVLSNAVQQGAEQLRERLRRGEVLPPHRPHYMTAWCHGAPGIALSRLRALELMEHSEWRDDAATAVETTASSLGAERPFSLCHGVAGNAEPVVMAASAFDRPGYRKLVESVAFEAGERHEGGGRPWRTGVPRSPEPSLLLGEAGIGLFYLRLSDPTTPSVLAPAPPRDGGPLPPADPALVRSEISAFFGGTLEALELVDSTQWTAEDASDSQSAPVLAVARTLERRVESGRDALPGSPRGLRPTWTAVEEAYALDRAAFDLALEPLDQRWEFVHGLTRPAPEEIDWDGKRWTVNSAGRLVRLPGGRAVILLRRGGTVLRHPTTPLLAAVFETLSERPSTAAKLVDRIRKAAGFEGPQELLRDRIMDQVRSAVSAGIVVGAEAPNQVET